MRHRLTSIDNLLRGIMFGGLLAVVAAVIAVVLANANDAPLRTVRAGDPGYPPTASNTEGIPEAVRTDIPPAMLPVPVGTDEAVATMWAKNAPYATETAIAVATMQAESAPYATQTALVVNGLTATTVP